MTGGEAHPVLWMPMQAGAAVRASRCRAAVAAAAALLLVTAAFVEGALVYPKLPATLLVSWELPRGYSHVRGWQQAPRNPWTAFSPLPYALAWLAGTVWIARRGGQRPAVERRRDIERDLLHAYLLAPAAEALQWSGAVAVVGAAVDRHYAWQAWLAGRVPPEWPLTLAALLAILLVAAGRAVSRRRRRELRLLLEATEEKGSLAAP